MTSNKALKDQVEEIWKPVIGYEGLYEVSNLGNVKSLPRMTNSRFGQKLSPGRILKPQRHKLGYLRCDLSNGTTKHYLVHRLVAEAFLPKV